MTEGALRAAVSNFLDAVDRVAPFGGTYATLKGFPKGCCKDASFLFARILDLQCGLRNMEYVWGQRGPTLEWVTHGWLETEEFILDVTGDQFSDFGRSSWVVSREDSSFHRTWEHQSRSSYPGFWSFHQEAEPDFERSSAELLEAIADGNPPVKQS